MDDSGAVRRVRGISGDFGHRLPFLPHVRHSLPRLRDDSGIPSLPAPGFCRRLAIPPDGLFLALSAGAFLEGWDGFFG